MRVRTIIVATMFSSALALVGCSDPAPIEPNGPATSATPTQVAPTLPEAAKDDSEEGAVAFVKHYIELLNYAANTGDVKPLRDASDPNCEGCNSYIALFEETYANGGYFKDPGWQPLAQQSSSTNSKHDVWIEVNAPENRYRPNRTAKEEFGAAGHYTLFFSVTTSGTPKTTVFERQDG